MATEGGTGPRSGPAATATFALGAMLAVVLGEAIRAIFPLLYNVREEGGSGTAVLWAVGVFVLGPLVIALLLRQVATVGVAVLIAALILAASRGALQVLDPIPLWLAGLAVAAGLVALALQIDLERARGHGARLGVALLVGLAIDSAIRGAFLTWDPVWQEGLAPSLVAVAVVAGLVAAAVSADRSSPTRRDPADGPTWSVALLGPFFLLQLQFLQNAAFAASDAGVGIDAAIALILVGDLLAVLAATLVSAHPVLPWRLGAGAVVIAGTTVLAAADGAAIAFALPVTSAAAAVLLVLALAARRAGERMPSPRRSDAAVAVGMAVFVGVAFAYQIDIDAPLPVPRAGWPIAAAVLLALAATRTMRPVELPRWLVAIPTVGLVIPAVLAISAGSTHPEPASAGQSEFRILDWNIHTAVNGDGQVDMSEVETLIASQDPDVIVLQEVGRGWPIAGQVDQAEWLSRRLDMPYRWASAADDQFGNVILSKVPITGVDVLRLPFGEGPQHRSALRVHLETGTDVIGAHLQNGDKPRTREAQIIAILDAWGPSIEGAGSSVVLAGDLNMQPTEDNRQLFVDAGLTSVQDMVGDPTASTARDPNFPGDRVDWIWGAGFAPEDFAILQSDLSDHLPLVVTVTV